MPWMGTSGGRVRLRERIAAGRFLPKRNGVPVERAGRARRVGHQPPHPMIVDLAAQHAMDHLKKAGFDHLTDAERILATGWQFAAGVANDGFAGYYRSRRGDLAFHAPEALRAIGANELAKLAEEANAQFGDDGPSPDRTVRGGQLRELGEEEHGVFAVLEKRYFEAEESIDALFEAWYERHKAAMRRAA